jgi:hypothetical protein
MERFLIKLFACFAVLYLVWHWGRWYQAVQDSRVPAVRTYFFASPRIVDPLVNATGDLFVTGDLRVGYCVESN